MRVFVVCALVGRHGRYVGRRAPVATPGVSSDEIHLGSSVPLSGEAAIAGNVARGIDAYFKYVNDKGGVLGRKLKYTYLDDGYDPGRAVNNTIRLDPAGAGLRGLQLARDEQQPRGAQAAERREGAAALRVVRRDDVRPGLQEVPVDDRLHPAVFGGRRDLRALRRQEREEAEGRRSVPERRLRARSAGRPEARARREGEVDRRERRLRPDVLGRAAAGDAAEGLEGERADGVRLRQVLAAGVQRRVAARLEAADLRQRRVVGSRR